MQTANYRNEVLWPIAYKLGLDPTKNLLPDRAEALAVYINANVRKYFDAADYPEWTLIQSRVPVNHVVPYDTTDALLADAQPLGRLWKVYLVDPATTEGPVDTPFKLLETGIHVGFEHGTQVWLKFMRHPPKFTSTKWDAALKYGKGALVYSNRSGECYRSKANGNLGNDPAGMVIVELPGERLQNFAPDNPGNDARPGITVVNFTGAQPPPDPITTPAAGTVFYVAVYDSGHTLIGSNNHIATGAETISAIITAMATALDAALPASFTVTPDTTAKTITIQDGSFFTVMADYGGGTSNLRHFFPVTQTQAFIPAVVSVAGKPQMLRVTLNEDQAAPGAIYGITVTDTAGMEHIAQYVAGATDSVAQILAGLLAAVEGSVDVFFDGVAASVDTNLYTFTLSTREGVSLDAKIIPPGSAWWELVPFPLKLVEPVVRGAYADALREGGQSDKAVGEEQGSGTDAAGITSKQIAPAYDPLTDQAMPTSRYRIGVR